MKIAELKQSKILQLSGIFLIWRLCLLVTAWAAGLWFTYAPSFPYANAFLKETGLPRWIYSWANFDGVHYLTVIKDGYMTADFIQAFFPVYPLFSRLLYYLGLEPIQTGLIVANIAALVLLFVWYYFLRNFFNRKDAFIGVLLFLTFPTSFYLGAFYTESIFMLLTIGAFYAAHRERWLLVALLTALATATRVVGIALVPALLVEIYLQANGVHTVSEVWDHIKNSGTTQTLMAVFKEHKRALFAVIIGSIGLFSYMLYLLKNFNDPLYFFHVQEEFGGGRSETLIIYPQVVWRYVKILATNVLSWRYLTVLQEAIAGIFGLIGLLASLKYIRLSWVIFSLGIFIIPTFTGTFSSMPRYILPCFALFILMIKIFSDRKRLFYIYLLISTILLAINTMLFVQGYWVA